METHAKAPTMHRDIQTPATTSWSERLDAAASLGDRRSVGRMAPEPRNRSQPGCHRRQFVIGASVDQAGGASGVGSRCIADSRSRHQRLGPRPRISAAGIRARGAATVTTARPGARLTATSSGRRSEACATIVDTPRCASDGRWHRRPDADRSRLGRGGDCLTLRQTKATSG